MEEIALHWQVKTDPAGGLGQDTKLGHTFGGHGKLAALGKALKASADKGWRDNYTLAEVAHTIIRYYENNYQKYTGWMDLSKNKIPSFKRNTICGNILEQYSAVKRTVEHGSYVQTNIAHCGNVWLCPVCASLIQSRRADEVQQCIDWAEEQGYRVVMVTYTASHYANMPLRDFGKKLQIAYRATMHQVARLRKRHEVGNIKAVEFTYSEMNRWHKHFHVVYILNKACHVGQFYEKVQSAWELQCAKVGLLDTSNEKAVESFRKHGCSLSINVQDFVAEYTNKSASTWTIADEVAKSVIKVGHFTEHMTPFQILGVIATTTDEVYRKKLINAFIEYAINTKGLHQMDWSNGLKSKVGIADLTDEELADEQNDTAEIVAGLTVAHWHILRSKYMRIRYFKMLKEADKQDKSVYQQIVDFFADTEVAGADCPDVLTAEQTQLLEEYEDREDTTAAEDEEYKLLQTVLEAVAEATPRTFCASSKHKAPDFIALSESEKEYLRNRRRWELLDYGITATDIEVIKSLDADTIKAYKQKFTHKMCKQMSLF